MKEEKMPEDPVKKDPISIKFITALAFIFSVLAFIFAISLWVNFKKTQIQGGEVLGQRQVQQLVDQRLRTLENRFSSRIDQALKQIEQMQQNLDRTQLNHAYDMIQSMKDRYSGSIRLQAEKILQEMDLILGKSTSNKEDLGFSKGE